MRQIELAGSWENTWPAAIAKVSREPAPRRAATGRARRKSATCRCGRKAPLGRRRPRLGPVRRLRAPRPPAVGRAILATAPRYRTRASGRSCERHQRGVRGRAADLNLLSVDDGPWPSPTAISTRAMCSACGPDTTRAGRVRRGRHGAVRPADSRFVRARGPTVRFRLGIPGVQAPLDHAAAPIQHHTHFPPRDVAGPGLRLKRWLAGVNHRRTA